MPQRSEGPTPAGGAYALAWGYDETGTETDDLASATTVNIAEYDEAGTLILCTLGGHCIDTAEDVGRIPAVVQAAGEATDPWNTELTKGTWDVRRLSDKKPVQTLDELLEALGWDWIDPALARAYVANAMTLPSWVAAPAGLVAEAEALFT